MIFHKVNWIAKIALLSFSIIGCSLPHFAQTNSAASGNWITNSNWSPATAPTGSGIVNVNHIMTVNTNLNIGGTYTINSGIKDLAGGTAYTLQVSSGGVIDFKASSTFEGTLLVQGNGTLYVRNGVTLTVGSTTFANNSIVLIEFGGTLIVNGTLTNNNNSTGVTVYGQIYVNGDVTGGNGSIITGTGGIQASGTISTSGSGTIFNTSGNICFSPPCGIAGIPCTFTGTITSAQVICPGSAPNALSSILTGGSNPSYLWEYYTVALGVFNTASGTNNASTYAPPALTTTTSYRLRITSGTCTGYSNAINVTTSGTAAAPSGTGTISGTNTLCAASTGIIYSVSGLSGVSTYNWTIPSGLTITSGVGTNSITVSFSGTSGIKIISVSGTNTCSGTGSSISSYSITVNPLASLPGAISGTTATCPAQTGISYSVTSVSGNTYAWIMPAGFTVTSGANTNSIIVSISGTAVSGTLSVTGTNNCSSSGATTKAITVQNSIAANSLTAFSNSICANTSPLSTLSGTTPTGGDGTYTYLWESSTTNSTSGFTTASGTTSNASYIPGSLASTTWFRRIASSSSCASNTSTAIRITVLNQTGNWIGNTNDWHSSINWCGSSVPGISTDVILSSGNAFYPAINTSNASARNITLSGATTLTINSPNTLSISGNFLNSGSFTASTGSSVVMNGSGIQTITGVSTFYNLLISKSATNIPVILASNQSIKGSLTLGTNSVLNNGSNTLILISNSVTGTARIASIPSGASITGNVSVQRFIPAKRAYRYLSSPISNATLATWQSAMYITGNGTGSDAGSSVPTVSYYYEPYQGGQSAGFFGIWTGMSTAVTTGKGYRVSVRGDKSLSLTALGSAPTNTTLTMTGTINSGNVNIPVSYTSTIGGAVSIDGWNLVGNPYPSQIDWDLLSTNGSSTNIDNAYYAYDPRSDVNTLIGSYFNYVNGVATGSRSSIALRPNPKIIPSCQGFFVHANSISPILLFGENMKSSTTPTDNFRKDEIPNLLYVRLENNKDDDNTAIRFLNEATGRFDAKYDAYKLNNSGVNISSLVENGNNLSINSLSDLDIENQTVALNVQSSTTGKHTLNFSNTQSFPNHIKLSLTDVLLNTTVTVSEGLTYDFNISTISGSKGMSRFYINFTPQFGKVAVSLFPKLEGAKWQLNNNWYNDGDTAINVPIGDYTIAYKELTNWKTPNANQIHVTANTITTISGIYLPQLKNNPSSEIDTLLSTNDIKEPSKFSILAFPNPIKENALNLYMSGLIGDRINIEIYSLKGEVIYQTTLSNQKMSQKIETKIELRKNLPYGVYVLKILNDKSQFIMKIVK